MHLHRQLWNWLRFEGIDLRKQPHLSWTPWAFYTRATLSISLTLLWPNCSFWSVNHVCFRAPEPFLHSFLKWLKWGIVWVEWVRDQSRNAVVCRQNLMSGTALLCSRWAAGESAVCMGLCSTRFFDLWPAIRLDHLFM